MPHIVLMLIKPFNHFVVNEWRHCPPVLSTQNYFIQKLKLITFSYLELICHDSLLRRPVDLMSATLCSL